VAYGHPAGAESGVYLVVWQDGWNGEGGDSNILGLRVSPEGKVLDAKPIAICAAAGIQETPAVSWNGKEFLVVWSDLRNKKDCDIYMARLGADGKVIATGLPVAVREHNQARPRIASLGGLSLVVWQDLRDKENYRVFGARVSEAGEVLDKEGLELCKAPSAMPTVTASADQFLVVWSQASGIFYGNSGVRVDKEGKIVDKPFAAHGFHGGGGVYPSAASDGKDFLFVCARQQPPNYWGWGGPGAVYGARVLADGSTPEVKGVQAYKYNLFPCVLDTANAHKGLWPHWYTAVAWDGKEYVALWTRCHQKNTVNLLNSEILATRIRFPDWQKLDSPTGPIPADAPEMKTPPVVGLPVAETPDYETMPALAAGEKGALLAVYEVNRSDGAFVVTAKVLTAP
jgi:hypothetical protein